MTNSTQVKTASWLERLMLVGGLPLIPKIALFMLLTVLLMGATFLILPRLVVLGPWGYAAAFIINGLSSASVIIPGPGFTVVMVMAKELDPFLLGIAAGIGGTLGELTGYWLGAQSRDTMEGNRTYNFILNAMNRLGGVIILIFGMVPVLPVDAAGVLAGASRYPVPKFLFYLGIGKLAKSIAILYLTARAFEWAEPYLKWIG
jgi:membrane protein YqaA with SNARE-associated domain